MEVWTMRKRARTDSNQAAMATLLRRLGCSVVDTHTIGGGFPDLVVGIVGRTFLVEVKDGDKSPSRRRLTADEFDFHRDWRGHPPVILESEEEAIRWVGTVRGWLRQTSNLSESELSLPMS